MLSPSTPWVEAAAAAAGEARLLVELKPTVLYDEVTREDWADAESASSVDQEHPSGELRLAAEDVVAVRQSTTGKLTDGNGNYTFYRNKDYEPDAESAAKDRYDDIGQFIQTVSVDTGFRLSKLRVGARATEWIGNKAFNNSIIVRLFTDLRTPTRRSSRGATTRNELAIDGLYQRAKQLWSGEANYSGDYVEPKETVSHNGQFLEFDLSGEYVYLPGGDRLNAIDLQVDFAKGAEHVALFGSASGGYDGGRLLEHDHASGHSFDTGGDLAFELVAEGFAETGTAVYELDLGSAPGAGLSGELELKYVDPAGSSVTFRFRESSNGSGWTSWASCDDGTALNDFRYVQVEATLNSDSNQLHTPRVLSIRAAYKRSDSFMLASGPLEGAPPSVYNAPGYSVEGNPLDGTATVSDTSEITLLDPDSMLADNLLAGYNIKNDEVAFSIGWNLLSSSEYLKIKTLYIENWHINDNGTVTLNLYDQQARFKNIEIPSAYDGDPSLSEQIHFDGTLPGTIKTELLRRAGIRPSRINTTSMTALNTGFPWSLVHGVEKQTKAQKICEELNRHLLSFEYIDETGKWQSPYVDFTASPVATIYQEDILLDPVESYDPGWERVKNVAAVFFDGEGDNESDYGSVALLTDSASMKAFKEVTADRLLSEWIPQDDDPGDTASGIAATIVKRRRALQADGLRVVSFATRIDQAKLQLGDHVYFNAKRYARPGASSTNPLTCFIISKNISPDLSHISWTALVLLDAEQSAPSVTAVGAPSNLTITNNADRTVDISWTASVDDTGTAIKRYEIFIRRKTLKNWGGFRTTKAADGSASYTVSGVSLTDVGVYDFGVRAVHKNRRVSQMATALAQSVSDTTLAAPSWLLVPVPGGWQIKVTGHVTGALFYRVYQYGGQARGWESAGSVTAKRKVKQTSEPTISARLLNGYGIEYGRFMLATVNEGGTGTLSAEQSGWSLPWQGAILASSLAPGLPAEGGTYPTLLQVQNESGEYKYAVTLKITAPSGYEDLVGRYEIQRRDNGGGSYGDWELVGTRVIENYPAPSVIYWTNHDARLKPGVSYQWRVRAIAQDGTESGFSSSLTKEVAVPTTPFDKPSVTVTASVLGLVGVISTPLRGASAVNERYYHKIEVNHGSGWSTWEEQYGSLLFIYQVTTAQALDSIQFRITAYDQHENASTVSDASSAKSAELIDAEDLIISSTVVTGLLAFTPLISSGGTGAIVATINASSEGLRISAGKIEINGSVDFAAGYNPTDKVAGLGGQYNSAASGARVRIFPDANTGILVTDGTNDVFKCLVGGADVGDVILGNPSGEHAKWDKSASTFAIEGSIKTSSGNDRVEITGDSVDLYESGTLQAYMRVISGSPRVRFVSGSQYFDFAYGGFTRYDGTKNLVQLVSGAYSQLVLTDDGTSDSISIQAGLGISGPKLAINGIAVVHSQKAHIADADGTLADITTKFNTLLTRLEAGTGHGLLASS